VVFLRLLKTFLKARVDQDTAEDLQVAIESVRLARRIAQQPALAVFQPTERLTADVGKMQTGDEADAYLAKTSATTIFHPVGTTKMGRATDPMVHTTSAVFRVVHVICL
jgi:choline dehydrogenase-like flavoprotein